ncbi:hypothetical protein HY414_02170 [Candidatus Kaiserbacteria bacterium]|nr:hypothetical protein [Candidatus Kaiserbacteria bacterium]
MEAGEKTTAVAVYCSDPRIARVATSVNESFRKELGVDEVIALPEPGGIDIFARPVCGRDDDIRREAFLIRFRIHMRLHRPQSVAIASHHGCLGHPGSDEQQERDTRRAAKVLLVLLRERCSFEGPVRSGMLDECSNPGWSLRMLD